MANGFPTTAYPPYVRFTSFYNVGVRFESAYYSWLFCSRETTHSVRKNTKYSRRNSVRPEKVQAHKVLYQKWHFMLAWFYKHIWYHIIQHVHFILYCTLFFYSIWHTFRVSSRCIRVIIPGRHHHPGQLCGDSAKHATVDSPMWPKPRLYVYLVYEPTVFIIECHMS